MNNDTPQTPGVNLALFADDTCLYATDRKEPPNPRCELSAVCG
jgi:hypothetical protein